MRRSLIATTTAAALLATSVAATAAPPTLDRSGIRPAGPVQIELSVLGTYATGVFDQSAAEIVAHDPATQRLFVVNAQSGLVDVLDISDPTDPTRLFDLNPGGTRAADDRTVDEEGAVINSVAVGAGIVAAAVEAPERTDEGWVVFFDVDGMALNALRVGALPDMLTFTPDGRTLLVANEGEPNDAFTIDPEGSVSVIDVAGPIEGLTQDDVRTADFRAWDRGDQNLHPDVRVFGPDVTGRADGALDEPGRIARNLEPEYVVADADNRTAYVMLQEANAFAVLDIASATFTDIVPLGFKDHLLPGNELDVSDRDDEIRIASWPVFGMYQPDGFDAYRWRGQTLLVTANEGDARADFGDFEEDVRFANFGRGRAQDPPPVCVDDDGKAPERIQGFLDDNELGIETLDELADAANLGRLNLSRAQGLRYPDESEGAFGPCYEELYSFGARSFSIWTTDGTLVYDSGSELERITAEIYPDNFNSNHRQNSFETRSDDKGPEPEDVTIGRVAGRAYAFIGLERIGGVMVYDISDPRAPFFVQYLNNRDFTAESDSSEAGDLGAEGLIFIEAGDSPTRRPMLAVANEVSGTTTLFDITTTNPGQGRGR
ncbi:MAG: choice-of-anchor I family protein [Nitriliruptoraceae bacterium]